MALTNLSPRQKMINMMYLVLLAILALNVSAEALNAFTRLRSQLRHTAVEADRNGDDLILRMKAEIDREVDNQGKTGNVGLRDTLDQLQQRTQGVIGLIEQHLDTIEQMARWDPEIGEYRRKDEQEENFRYWMGSDEVASETILSCTRGVLQAWLGGPFFLRCAFFCQDSFYPGPGNPSSLLALPMLIGSGYCPTFVPAEMLLPKKSWTAPGWQVNGSRYHVVGSAGRSG